MKKVGIITIFHTYNYGAVLQAYATYEAITKLGYECEMINYDNKTMKSDRKMFLPPNNIYNIIRDIRSLKNYRDIKKRITKFEQFIARMPVSTEHWENTCSLEKTAYDILVTGSDQTFCLHLRNKPDEMKPFFLPGVITKKCISYAPSLGEKISEINEAEANWMKGELCKYKYLSVRDDRSADYIEKLIGVRPKIVLDPTLLINRNMWDGVEIDSKINNLKSGYIFFYTVLSEQWVVDYAKNISAKFGLPLIAVHNQTRYEISTNIKRIVECGPEDFIKLIKNASYVLTTSFHATAFAIQYEKPLQVMSLGEGNRLSSLLGELDMLEALVFKGNTNNIRPFYTNYAQVKHKLETLRSDSLSYLREALSN